MNRSYGPEDFSAAARRSLEKAKRALSPDTKAVLTERAKVLTRTAIEFERSLAIRDNLRRLLRGISTLDDLKRALAALRPGKPEIMETEPFLQLIDAGLGTELDRRAMLDELSLDYDCEFHFSSEGTVSFVKRELISPAD